MLREGPRNVSALTSQDHLSLYRANPLTSSQMTRAWKTVACGGTKDQLFMQEKARQLLGRLKSNHTSRTLILS